MPEDNNQDQKAYYEAARTLNERAFQAKERMRKRLAALSFDDKIKILEKLRAARRQLQLRALGERCRRTPESAKDEE